MKKLLLLLLLLPGIISAQKKAYPPPSSLVQSIFCDFPGTRPQTAIPVCGTKVFHQDSVFDCPACLDINPNQCPGSNFPFYEDTCYF